MLTGLVARRRGKRHINDGLHWYLVDGGAVFELVN
jgi:hypothetical protein